MPLTRPNLRRGDCRHLLTDPPAAPSTPLMALWMLFTPPSGHAPFRYRQLLKMSDKLVSRQITASKEPLLELAFYFGPLSYRFSSPFLTKLIFSSRCGIAFMEIILIVNIHKVSAPPFGFVESFAARSMGTAVVIVQPSLD